MYIPKKSTSTVRFILLIFKATHFPVTPFISFPKFHYAVDQLADVVMYNMMVYCWILIAETPQQVL